ncbi:MAG: hypothetical protein KDH97_11955 [Calditrichaeota bacterium]|nr:hypothetical protein [Calditrichota bacterium]MCB0296847.1 hypothetical protein [Calditrichota bacterium]MCB0307095.1 hypothetical protein [Calditrichota bacterium]MCB0315771.1 hypothetical protein [Calditrichota bacterium]
MKPPQLKSQKLIAIFFLGLMLWIGPLLTLFNLPDMVLGIPIIFLYLFAVWVLLILFMVIVVEYRGKNTAESSK